MNIGSGIYRLAIGLGASVLFSGAALSATITAVTTPGAFTSTSIISNDFEGTYFRDFGQYEFTDASTTVFPTNANQLARSGITWLGDVDQAVEVSFSVAAYEVGAYVGNDQFLAFGPVDFFLDAYGTSDNLLGTVKVTGNGDDRINQFIGLRSDMILGRAVFRITSSIRAPGMVLDDFQMGYEVSLPISLPTSFVLFGLGLTSLGLAARRRKTA